MSEIKVADGQNIMDIAMQEYDDITKVYQLIQDNNLPNLMLKNLTGMTLSYTDPGTRNTIYYKTNKIQISSSFPIITVNRQFDDSFDGSFR